MMITSCKTPSTIEVVYMALYIKHGDWPMVDSIWPFIKWIATALVHLAGHYMAPKPLYGSKLPLYLPRYFQDLYRARK